MKNFFSFYNPRIGEGDSKIQALFYYLSQRFVKRVWNAETREKKKIR